MKDLRAALAIGVARVYFGHPINTYGTPLEQELIQRIEEELPGSVIVNPGAEEHQEMCALLKEHGRDAMPYFLDLVRGCDAGIFLLFRDGAWGARTAKEARVLLERGRPAAVFRGNRQTGFRLASVDVVPERTVLSRDETRARIYSSDGTIAPY